MRELAVVAWGLWVVAAGSLLSVGCAGTVDSQGDVGVDGAYEDAADASVRDGADASVVDAPLSAEGGPVDWCPPTAPKDGSPCEHPGLKCVRACGAIGDYTAVCGRITDTFGYWGVTYPCGRDGG